MAPCRRKERLEQALLGGEDEGQGSEPTEARRWVTRRVSSVRSDELGDVGRGFAAHHGLDVDAESARVAPKARPPRWRTFALWEIDPTNPVRPYRAAVRVLRQRPDRERSA